MGKKNSDLNDFNQRKFLQVSQTQSIQLTRWVNFLKETTFLYMGFLLHTHSELQRNNFDYMNPSVAFSLFEYIFMLEKNLPPPPKECRTTFKI